MYVPTVYVFTQTEKSKSENVANNIRNIAQEGVIDVLESKPIDGYYELSNGIFLRDSIYTTASKIAIRFDVTIGYFKELLKSVAGVIDPLILVQKYEKV